MKYYPLRRVRTVLLICGFASLLASCPVPSTTANYIGNWLNDDPNTSGVAQLIILPDTYDHVKVLGFGSCSPINCIWGEATALFERDPQQHDWEVWATYTFDNQTIDLFMQVDKSTGHMSVTTEVDYVSPQYQDYAFTESFHRAL